MTRLELTQRVLDLCASSLHKEGGIHDVVILHDEGCPMLSDQPEACTCQPTVTLTLANGRKRSLLVDGQRVN